MTSGAEKIAPGVAWGVIPARGGSKSIPLKNLASLGGRPLIEYVIGAARHCERLQRIICSTDHPEIAHACRDRGVEVHPRPSWLGADETPLVSVLQHFLRDLAPHGPLAEFLAILQPTSPFVSPADLAACLAALDADPEAESAQTVASMPHNFHAYNQRVIEDGLVRFRFVEERRRHYNKQTKPSHYCFGNLVVARTASILDAGSVFGERSRPVEIPARYALDVDGPEDLETAEWLLATGRVRLPWLAEEDGPRSTRRRMEDN